jgi:hypothetical protein
MSHRTQITLADEQYDRLRAESQRTGLGLAELVRRALDRTYGATGSAETMRALDASFGAWMSSDDDGLRPTADGAGYVERLRHGLGRRLDDA